MISFMQSAQPFIAQVCLYTDHSISDNHAQSFITFVICSSENLHLLFVVVSSRLGIRRELLNNNIRAKDKEMIKGGIVYGH